jgi:hypothetical protein
MNIAVQLLHYTVNAAKKQQRTYPQYDLLKNDLYDVKKIRFDYYDKNNRNSYLYRILRR